jgi:hypothetical protein
MTSSTTTSNATWLAPEKVAYWYFRLNGFFQLESFVIHPAQRGAQETDADLLAVRFPFRAERLIDNPKDVMPDDNRWLTSPADKIDVAIVEVKTNQPCTLNGPWKKRDRQNVHRVLAAIGCIPHLEIEPAAAKLYDGEVYQNDSTRIRLVAIGRDRNQEIPPGVMQLIWSEILEFIVDRFHRYQRQKAQVDQWDPVGRKLKELAEQFSHRQEFVRHVLDLMGIQYVETSRSEGVD